MLPGRRRAGRVSPPDLLQVPPLAKQLRSQRARGLLADLHGEASCAQGKQKAGAALRAWPNIPAQASPTDLSAPGSGVANMGL